MTGAVSPASLLGELDRATAAFTAVLRTGPLTARVPSCPDYDVAGLAPHLGGVHVWARAAVSSEQRPPPPPDGPADDADLADWYADAARDLLAALRATPPGTPCWTFAQAARTAAFWLRRQAHEATVHTWDAQSAVGVPDPLDPAVAADGVDEVLTFFVPRQVELGRLAPLDHAVALEATDTGSRWVLGTGEPSASVTGPAEALLLLLWKRIGLDDPRLEATGNAAHALEGAITP